MKSEYQKGSGLAPDRRACPNCGRIMGGFFALGRFQMARHTKPGGGKCRTLRAPGSGAIVAKASV